MRLVRLRTHHHRNLNAGEISLESRISVMHGPNAQGKTNLIEAVYLLSNLQSFRTHRLRDLVAFPVSESRISGRVVSDLGASILDVSIGTTGRRAQVDSKKPTSMGDYLRRFPTVLFCPQDLDLARGNQELRRRFIDRAVFLSDPTHLDRLRNYQLILRHRNALLKSKQMGLDVWDEKLAVFGAQVHRARVKTLDELGPLAAGIHAEIAGGKEKPTYRCEAPYCGGWDDSEEGLLDLLSQARDKDRRIGHTTVGPHRDRIRIDLGGGTVERHGSQGQMRSVALSLKLALLIWGEKNLGHRPVFLLDDPGSELDDYRLGHLGDFIASWKGQVLITGTRANAVPLPKDADTSYFLVENGHIDLSECDIS